MRTTTVLAATALVAVLGCSRHPAPEPDVPPLTFPAGQPAPLIFIDGQRQTSTVSLTKLRPADIDRVEVVKGATALFRYGPEGQNGVVLVYTKPVKRVR